MKRFALIGAAGYVAPRHMEAIKATGNDLIAALDPHDSVGILDRYFPDVHFFTEFERFDRHLEKLRRQGDGIDYLVVCSPNYLHDAHCRFGMRLGANVICEKPIVLNPWNLDGLAEIEEVTGKKVFNILQLRLHEEILQLKATVDAAPQDRIFDIELTYITSRGRWYFSSWKSNLEKSGGVATNIGIHFFDMLLWIFGNCLKSEVYQHESDRAGGSLLLERARVNWFLSINADTLPEEIKAKEQRTYRNISIDGKTIEFSKGFSELHIKSYQSILQNKGFDLEAARPALALVHQIRNAEIESVPDNVNQFLNH